MTLNISPRFSLYIDNKTKTIKYTNAGHTRALYYRSTTKKVLALDTNGFFIGLSQESNYEEKTLSVEPGDRLLLYTDGITEIKNSQGEEFGENKLAKFIVHNVNSHGDKFLQFII